MSVDRQMTRSKTQALYKYLPESWIDFSLRGKQRKQYVAKVSRWNSEKLTGVNTKRLIRKVNEAVQAFSRQGAQDSKLPAITGFGLALSPDTCEVLTPKASEEERGIVAEISPLTFYCKRCKKVYQFTSADKYRMHPKCECGAELTQFRQIYFCQCGYATDKHPAWCKIHGNRSIKWDGGFNFICTECNQRIPMQTICKVCGERLHPKVALDPSQYFAYSLSLIDLIDEKIEKFLSETTYGKLASIAYRLGRITKEDLTKIINDGISTDDSEYQKIYKEMYQLFMMAFNDDTQASIAAKAATESKCGNKFVQVLDSVRTELYTTEESISKLAESILEFDMVQNLPDKATLDEAVNIARMLNTNANPEQFKSISERFGFTNVQVCDKIPFVTCSYGYTRVKPEYEKGVQLHAFKEEKNGIKNIYATKMFTEGVLFELDGKKIIEWLYKNEFITESDLPDMTSEESIKLWFVNNVRLDAIRPFNEINKDQFSVTSAVYSLLHSISHLLIRAVAEIGGLGKDSLSEYIFTGIPAILIYCQNSQGFNLGSLFNTFEAFFDKWMNRAYSDSLKCIYDPICLERYKACTGCLFLNEISCEHFNKDLDRSLVIGQYDRATKKRIIGFWEDI